MCRLQMRRNSLVTDFEDRYQTRSSAGKDKKQSKKMESVSTRTDGLRVTISHCRV
jgi:transposase-like protein